MRTFKMIKAFIRGKLLFTYNIILKHNVITGKRTLLFN